MSARRRAARPRAALATLLLLAAAAAPSAHAQNRAVPYWASLRDKQVNMHVGPARAYGSSWVYQRQGLPVKVLRLKEGWRLVRDPDGAQGWMLAKFLSPDRGALVVGRELADMRAGADGAARLLWRLEPGVVGKLGDCAGGWCKLDLGAGRAGYVAQARLWGAGAP